ncbi:type I restriction endonuclease subunit S [Gluconacetobacter azotocaptans]|uniref:Type I restriction endonuclease subunit S n=1 Tax=Gluconacetobacter azotocaptans TaxID=142834 RepID=A0A7W4PDQ4_9PROT|nr:restriction endonuclease subunit S [Gluconacetobacter azotocaptans]MBB2190527.1 type I restriction endonuclease subunit S [Gluconacetobacter azotocaptans]GBQ28439.1 restriction modification system DNA specificity subunit [Gluconacetobacter azotocaptans DSM 13594]
MNSEQGAHKLLPTSWATVRLGEFVQSEKGKKPKRESEQPNERFRFPYIDIAAFEEGKVKSWTDGDECRFCDEGDFLMVWDGSRSGLVGRGVKGALGSTLVRIRFDGMINDYAYYFLQSKYLEINSRAKGSGTPHVDPDLLWNYAFPIAPINEQRRIVERIETLLTQQDSARDALLLAQKQLKLYRHVVLRSAYEGELTKEWRTHQNSAFETAQELVARIQAERAPRQGKRLSTRKAARNPKDTDALSTEEREKLTTLPDVWAWIRLGELFDVYVGATPSRSRSEFWGGSVSWVSSGEVRFERIQKTKEQITDLGLAHTSTVVHPPGTVMLAMIGEGKTRGQAAILDISACHNQNTAAIRISETDCVPEYLFWYLQYQYQVTRTLGSGNNQKALNKERVSNITLPLAPVKEQQKIVNELAAKISIIERLEDEVQAGLQRDEMLRLAIFKRAFSGRLVAQDSRDEPASELLSRIREQAIRLKSKKQPANKNGKKEAA